MPLIDKMRQQYGADLSDEEVITRASKDLDVPVTDVAKELGYKSGGKWGSATGSAVDTAQGQLYDAAEAAASRLGWDGVAKAARGRRKQNEAEASIEGAQAEAQGLTTDWRGIRGLGDVGEFVGSTAIQSAPQMGATFAGASTGAAIGSLAGPVGTVVGGAIGAGAASLPFYFGANRSAQREQSMNLLGREQTDDASALQAAFGQSAIDAVGGGPVEGAIMRGARATGRGAARVLGRGAAEEAEGEAAQAAAAGAGKAAAKTFSAKQMTKDFAVGGAKEAAFSEVPQQVLEEYARQGVDSTHDLLGGAALGRYADSAVGALALGGPINVVTGAAGRSALGAKANDPNASKTDDPVGVPDSKYGLQPDMVGPPPELVGPRRGMPGEDLTPQAGQIVQDTIVGPANAAIAAKQAEGAPPTPEQQTANGVAAKADAIRAQSDEMAKLGIDPKHIVEYNALKEARDAGTIDQATFDEAGGALASGNSALISQVKSAIAEHQKGLAEQEELNKAAAAHEASPEGGAKRVVSLIDAFKDEKGRPLSGVNRDRLFMMLGLDEDGTPAGDRFSLEDVAQIEAGLRGEGAKPVTKQTISKELTKFGFDEQTINDLYDEIHGTTGGLTGDAVVTGVEGGEAGESAMLEAPERMRGARDSDESHMEDATEFTAELDDTDMGEGGSMQVVDSANKSQVVEESAKEQRKKLLKTLLKNPEYNDAQKAAVAKALGRGEKQGDMAGIRELLENKEDANKNKLFNDDEIAALNRLFEGGRTSAAANKRSPRVEAEIRRRQGILTEHEKQVREKIAAENVARRAREEQERIEKQAAADNFDEMEQAISEDARTLRMHLMDPDKKVRQPRLIGESLVDAKNTWADLVAKFAKRPEEFRLPPWEDLSPREQAAFVRTVDWANYDSATEGVSDLQANIKVEARADELAEEAGERKSAEAKRAAKEAELAKPEFKAKAAELRAKEEADRAAALVEKSKERAAERAEQAAKAAAAKKEKEDAKRAESASAQEPAAAQGQGPQGAGGSVGGQDGQEVQRGAVASAGKEVPQGGQGGAPDATAGAAHGPGPVRGGDEQTAQALADAANEAAAGEQAGGDVETLWTGGPLGDVDGSGDVQAALYRMSSAEEIEYGIQLENERWVTPEEAVEAAQLAMSPREQAMPYQYYRILGIHPNFWNEMVERLANENESDEVQSIERLNAARADSPAPLTVTASAGTQVEGGAQRTPSVTRVVRKARTDLDAGKVSAEAFAAQASAALDAADAVRERAPLRSKLRGADRIMEMLLAARRRGELDDEGVEMAMWLIRQNPAAVSNLGISVRAKGKGKGEANTSGYYNPVARIITLIKGSLNAETAVHEILHHLERMMPRQMQNAIRREWTKQLARAYKAAAGNESLSAYYKALMDYHFGNGSPKLLDIALDLLHSGEVDYDHYQMFNPSEFWAVNGSRIVQGRYGVSGSVLGRIKQYIKEFVQKVKSMAGMPSDNAVIRALDSVARSDGNFTSGMMLQDQPGVHFMYAGEKTKDQEALDQLQNYGYLKAGGSTGPQLRQATGWFRSPIDNEMKYEFSDHDATLKMPIDQLKAATAREEPTTYRLGDVLNHPNLYAAYPDARDIVITRQAATFDLLRTVEGWFSPDKNKVNITPYVKDPLSTLIHEVQHWVQQKEGFAGGGSPESVAQAMSPEQRERLRDRVLKEIMPQHEEQKRAIDFMTRLQGWPKLQQLLDAAVFNDPEFKILRDQAVKDLTGNSYKTMDIESAVMLDGYLNDQDAIDSQLDRMTNRVQLRQDQIDAVMAGDNPQALGQLGAATDALLRAYKHLAGEIEARDTQARQDLTPEERKATKPLSNAILEEIEFDDIVRVKTPATPTPEAVAKSVSQRYQNVERVTKAAMDRVPNGKPKEAVSTLGRMVGNSTKSLIKGLTFTRDLLAMAQPGMNSAATYGALEETRNAAKIAHLHEADKIVAGFKKLGVPERAAVNAFVKKSTMEGKWGFRPDWFSPEDRAKVKLDPDTKAAFDRLPPAVQQVVKNMFEHGHKTLVQMKTLVNLNVTDEFDAAIAEAKAAGDDKSVERLESDKAESLDKFKTLLAIGEYLPYSPLKRFGNHVVIGKSQAYMDAEAALDADPNDKAAAKALREMQSQPAHYYVAMRETKHEAQALRNEVSGQYQDAVTMEKDAGYLSEVGGNRGMLGMFHRLKGQAARQDMGGKERAATNRMMTDLYLSLLSETSARQAERERRNVAGADEDMMRAFHSKARADANFLAALATGGQMQTALSAMEREAGKNGVVNGTTREQRHELYKEILERHVQGMDYKQSPAVDFALQSASVMQLLTNPAYHLTNLLQPYVMSAPTMAGRFGMTRSLGALASAHRELGSRLFKNGVDHSSIQDLPTDVQRGIQSLMDKGLINMSLDSEHGAEWNEGKLGKATGWLKRVAERIEAVNRVATGVAALRLAKSAGMSEQAQIDYAAKIIYDTHGDYSGFNTPSLMRGPIARLATQYRKFQIIQISNYTRMVRDGFLRADLSKEEQWVARKALAYNLATMFALGGTLGLPGAQAIGAILRAVFGDDDEPDNPELTMRKYLSDVGLEGVSDLLVKGVPAWLGVDVSGRLGAGNILSLFPYAENFEFSRKAAESYALAATGPFIGGLVPKLFDGMGAVTSGDVYKGAEQLMPNGIGNILKGARIATQGVTMKNGDTVMAAEEVSALAGLGQMVGLPTTTTTERTFRAQALRDLDLHFKEKSSALKREYVRAYREGDAEALAEARADWTDMSTRMRAHGMQPPKYSELIKAPHQQGKRDKTLVQGVQTTRRTAGAAAQLAEI